MKELSNTEIKVLNLYGTIVRYIIIENELSICGDDFFNAILPETKKRHLDYLIEKGAVAVYSDGADRKPAQFFSLRNVSERLQYYKLGKVVYDKAIAKGFTHYENYIDLMVKGGINHLTDLIAEKEEIVFEFIEQPSVGHLKTEETQEIEKEEIVTPMIDQINKVETKKESCLRSTLKNEDSFLYSTLAVILSFLPFTFLAIYSNAHLEEVNIYIAYLMCFMIALAFDYSILIFAVNGKEKYANWGSFFQVIFISVHFNLITDIYKIIKYIFLDAEAPDVDPQSFIVRLALVAFGALLINQLSKLATKSNE